MPKQTFFNLPQEKRERILSVAIDEFAEKGFAAASVSAIVAAAGIAKGSFYQYFEDKDDLYIHIVSTMISQRKLMVFEREKHRLKDLNLTGYLRLVFRMQADMFRREPQLAKIGIDLAKSAGKPIYEKLMSRYQDMLGSFFVPFIEHEISQGELDPKVNVRLLNFMLLSLSQYMLYRLEREAFIITPEFTDSLLDDLEYILTNGIYFSGRGRA